MSGSGGLGRAIRQLTPARPEAHQCGSGRLAAVHRAVAEVEPLRRLVRSRDRVGPILPCKSHSWLSSRGDLATPPREGVLRVPWAARSAIAPPPLPRSARAAPTASRAPSMGPTTYSQK